MANKLDPMDIKQIITLHTDGLSNRKIGDTLGISRNTVNTYLKFISQCQYTSKELLEFENQKLRELFTAHTTIKNERYDELMRFLDNMHQHRNHPGFTLKFHYNQYTTQAKKPYSYTQFTEHYKRKYTRVKGSMKLDHQAGHEVYIDFAGKKLHLTDRETGELIPVEVFVAILPNSQYTYVQACHSQKREDLVMCMASALSYYAGVPKAIVSDNLKSAVSRASKYEPEINRTFKDFARHYNCAINPTRSYSPQDKALVENAVQLAYQRIYYPMREMTFFTLDQLNAEIKRLLESYNNLLFQRKDASRRELFQRIERACLKPLPQTPYELKHYARAKVQKIGYVYFSPDKNYYSVPYRYIGKGTQIQYTRNTVEVYHNHQRIASHVRNPSKGVYNTNKEHLSSTHKAYSDWSPAYFKQQAKKYGANVLACTEMILAKSTYPETAYKTITGIIQLHRVYGEERLNNACQRALYAQKPSYSQIKNILKNNLDREQLNVNELESFTSHIPKHDNLRNPLKYS